MSNYFYITGARSLAKSNLERKQRKIGLLVLGATIGAGLIGGSLVRWGATLPPAATFIGLLAIFALAVSATIPWWHSLDHMQRDAQYFSWYWGGAAGTAVVFVAVITFSGAQSTLTRGAILLATGQVLGFGVFWLFWRLRHSGGKA